VKIRPSTPGPELQLHTTQEDEIEDVQETEPELVELEEGEDADDRTERDFTMIYSTIKKEKNDKKEAKSIYKWILLIGDQDPANSDVKTQQKYTERDVKEFVSTLSCSPTIKTLKVHEPGLSFKAEIRVKKTFKDKMPNMIKNWNTAKMAAKMADKNFAVVECEAEEK